MQITFKERTETVKKEQTQEWTHDTFFSAEVIHGSEFAKRVCKVCGYTFTHHGMFNAIRTL